MGYSQFCLVWYQVKQKSKGETEKKLHVCESVGGERGERMRKSNSLGGCLPELSRMPEA